MGYIILVFIAQTVVSEGLGAGIVAVLRIAHFWIEKGM